MWSNTKKLRIKDLDDFVWTPGKILSKIYQQAAKGLFTSYKLIQEDSMLSNIDT